MGVVGTSYVYKVKNVWNVRLRLDLSATLKMTPPLRGGVPCGDRVKNVPQSGINYGWVGGYYSPLGGLKKK
jgi:hypothetical protein